MFKAFLRQIKARRDFNRCKRQLNQNATSRALIGIVTIGALSVGKGRRIVPVGRRAI